MKKKIEVQNTVSLYDIFDQETSVQEVCKNLQRKLDSFETRGVEFKYFDIGQDDDGNTRLYLVGTRDETDIEEQNRLLIEKERLANTERDTRVLEQMERELYERLKKKFEGEN